MSSSDINEFISQMDFSASKGQEVSNEMISTENALQGGEMPSTLEGGVAFKKKPLRSREMSAAKKKQVTKIANQLERTDLPYQYAKKVTEDLQKAADIKDKAKANAKLVNAIANIDNAVDALGLGPYPSYSPSGRFKEAELVVKDQVQKDIAKYLMGMRPSIAQTARASQVPLSVRVNDALSVQRRNEGLEPYKTPVLSEKYGRLA